MSILHFHAFIACQISAHIGASKALILKLEFKFLIMLKRISGNYQIKKNNFTMPSLSVQKKF